MIVFLTDGLPTTGVTGEAEIRRNVAQANTANLRVFSFGVGYDVNTRLLDGISREFGAFSDYISPEENIEERIGSFYDRVRYPVLTDLQFTLEGPDGYAFAPARLPDLYKDGQLILAGRYRRPGAATLTLTGTAAGRQTRRSYALQLPELEREREFVARLWATRRVGHLLDEIRMNGENDELKDEVVALAKEFGLVTPYTSYLVQEDEPVAIDLPGSQRPFLTPGIIPSSGRPRAEAAPPPGERMMATSGRDAVRMSQSIRAMQDADAAHPGEQSGLVAVKGRTLQLGSDGVWTDLEFDREKHPVERIEMASDAYFALLREHPEARDFARLGKKVIFRLDERYIEIF
jgi:Ca-activated chloride channel homolog